MPGPRKAQPYDESKVEYCISEFQKRIYTLYGICKSNCNETARKAAPLFPEKNITAKCVSQVVCRIDKYAGARGVSAEHNLRRPAPEGFTMSGFSDMRENELGKPIWYKFSADKERQHEMMVEAIESLCKEIRPLPPIDAPTETLDELMSVYPMGDPHFGMYSWAAETGEDFDLKIAEHDLYAAVDYLVDRSPASRRGILVNLGDFFHAENMEGITTRSGHILDMDTRFDRMIDVGVTALRRCIDRMLAKHEQVEMVNAPGNHDETLAKCLNVMFRNLYANEPRVTVISGPPERTYIRHGKVLIGVVHGHKTKDHELVGIMATEKPQDWGETKHRYFYRGHHHHDKVIEYNGGKVEQFRTLAAKDAYAAGNGYLSGRDMKCIVHHRDYGEQSRFTCGIDVLRDRQGAARD